MINSFILFAVAVLCFSNAYLFIKVYELSEKVTYVSLKLENYLQLFRMSKEKEIKHD